MARQLKIEPAEDAEADVAALFRQYLEVCNRAIAAHERAFPYQQMLSVGEALFEERPIELAVYDDRPKGAFSLRFKDRRLNISGEPRDAKKSWRVNLSYLQHVVNHPEDYIRHPEKLDLDWLKSRLGF